MPAKFMSKLHPGAAVVFSTKYSKDNIRKQTSFPTVFTQNKKILSRQSANRYKKCLKGKKTVKEEEKSEQTVKLGNNRINLYSNFYKVASCRKTSSVKNSSLFLNTPH